MINLLDNFLQTQYKVVNSEGLNVWHRWDFFIIIYYPGVKETSSNSCSVASNEYSKPAENKKAMNIQQQSFILEMARYGLGQKGTEGVFVCAKEDKYIPSTS